MSPEFGMEQAMLAVPQGGATNTLGTSRFNTLAISRGIIFTVTLPFRLEVTPAAPQKISKITASHALIQSLKYGHDGCIESTLTSTLGRHFRGMFFLLRVRFEAVGLERHLSSMFHLLAPSGTG